MRCIFCKSVSDKSASVEHIIPESLGNSEHVLPRGWVCDSCNNYIANKIERPFLESTYGRNTRFEMRVQNKKGRVPTIFGFHAQSATKVELLYDSVGESLSVGAVPGEDEARWVRSVRSNTHGTLYIPIPKSPTNDYITARFIGKVALEALANTGLSIQGWNDEIVDKPELDELRTYVRYGNPRLIWPIEIRRIYAQDFLFSDAHYGSHEILHEWTILPTSEGEFYVVIAVFGIEYTINLGGPELDGYHSWLKANGGRNPLYK